MSERSKKVSWNFHFFRSVESGDPGDKLQAKAFLTQVLKYLELEHADKKPQNVELNLR